MNAIDQKKYDSAIKCYVPNNVMLEKEAVKLLLSIIHEIHASFVKATINNAKNVTEIDATEIDAKIVQTSISPLIPENLRRYAFANGSRSIALYQSGLIPYKEEVVVDEPVITDYKKGVKRILEDFNSLAARGFMPRINEYLNDVCYALAEKSSQHAKSNGGVLTANDVLCAVNEMLPNDLRQHAFARISQLQRRSILPPTKVRPKSAAAKNQISHLNESGHTEEAADESSTTFLGRVSQLFHSTEEKNQTTENETQPKRIEQQPKEEQPKMKEQQPKEQPKRKEQHKEKSILGMAWEWLSPSEENQIQANDEAESNVTI